ncbi:MAG: FkbM family methyltransferase [Verrucomicrobiia bacterium]
MKRTHQLKLDSKNYFRLSNELLLAAPPEVPFRDMFAEVVNSRCYLPSAEFRIKPGNTVLDIGANVGLFSIWVASNVPSARIFAFEAASDNFLALAENVRSNHFKGISAHHYAVSDGRNKCVTLYHGFHGGIHSIRPEYRNWNSSTGRPRRTERVRAITLEQIFSRFRIKQVDFLKLDCEGAEYDILLSAPGGVLSRIRRIVGEYHDLGAKRHGGVLKEFLTRRGFRTRFSAAGPDMPWGMFVATSR